MFNRHVFRSKRKWRNLYRFVYFKFRTQHSKAKSKIATLFPTALNSKKENLLLSPLVQTTWIYRTQYRDWNIKTPNRSMRWKSKIETFTKTPSRGGECRFARGRRGYCGYWWRPQRPQEVVQGHLDTQWISLKPGQLSGCNLLLYDDLWSKFTALDRTVRMLCCCTLYAPVNWNPHPLGPGEG